ncbi:MAG: PAS domain S-box protein [bacterium]|nr:PAS domain S-box protein [bacterium]
MSAVMQLKESTRLIIDYGTAVLAALMAVLLSAVFWADIVNSQYIFVIMAVAFVAWFGGFLPGMVTAIISFMLVNYFLISESFTFNLNPADQLRTFFLWIVVFIISMALELRLRSVDALQASRDQLQAILQNVAEGVTVQAGDGKVMYVNRAATEMLGFKANDDMMDMTLSAIEQTFELCDESGSPMSFSDLPSRQALRSGQPARRTIQIGQKSGGSRRWLIMKSTPITDENNRASMVVNVLTDITERRQYEEDLMRLNGQLERASTRINNILTNVPGIIWEGSGEPGSDPGQNIDFVNGFAEKMLGYSVEEWMTTPNFWQKLVHPDDWKAAMIRAQEIFSQGNQGTIQFRCVAKDGHEVWVESHSTIILDNRGNPVGVCGAVMDVTERAKAAQDLARSADELRRSNEELQQFAYVASHDLQEPLRMVTSYLQLIEQRYSEKLDDDAREFIGYAVDGASRMKALINDLLAYSRVETRRTQFTLVDFHVVIDRVKTNLKLAIEESGTTFEVDDLPRLMADEGQMVQLFQNLISNAIKFRAEEPPKITIKATRQRGEWQFCVGDNGIGMEKQYLDRIFIIFQRLHSKGKYPGTGIGLAICKKVVERHGGRIWAESAPGQGTTFNFTLPNLMLKEKAAGNTNGTH